MFVVSNRFIRSVLLAGASRETSGEVRPMKTQTAEARTLTIDLTEPRYPGKGIGYDWRSLVAAAEAASLDDELASLDSVPVD